MVNTQLHVSAILSLGEEPQYSLDRRCGGLPKMFWKLRKKKSSLLESNLDSPSSSDHSIHYPASLLASKGPFVLVLVGEDRVILTTILDEGKYCLNRKVFWKTKKEETSFPGMIH